jgi:hypothetical protein
MHIDWGSIESYCWACNFDYQEYVRHYTRIHPHDTPMTEESYNEHYKGCDFVYYLNVEEG